ncbi:hypothetical protein HDV57DRAFT_142285 [Trichoderma longibrachiatum]
MASRAMCIADAKYGYTQGGKADDAATKHGAEYDDALLHITSAKKRRYVCTLFFSVLRFQMPSRNGQEPDDLRPSTKGPFATCGFAHKLIVSVYGCCACTRRSLGGGGGGSDCTGRIAHSKRKRTGESAAHVPPSSPLGQASPGRENSARGIANGRSRWPRGMRKWIRRLLSQLWLGAPPRLMWYEYTVLLVGNMRDAMH